uniref:Putative secreted protein n=1 Tax=Anopheles marajoara TaxID=58244 RepID=A0A2M4CF63_9DIPT
MFVFFFFLCTLDTLHSRQMCNLCIVTDCWCVGVEVHGAPDPQYGSSCFPDEGKIEEGVEGVVYSRGT